MSGKSKAPNAFDGQVPNRTSRSRFTTSFGWSAGQRAEEPAAAFEPQDSETEDAAQPGEESAERADRFN